MISIMRVPHSIFQNVAHFLCQCPKKIARLIGFNTCCGDDVSDSALSENNATSVHLIKHTSLGAQNSRRIRLNQQSATEDIEAAKNAFQDLQRPISATFTAEANAALGKLIVEGNGQVHDVEVADGDVISIGKFNKEFELRNATIRVLTVSDAVLFSAYSCTIGKLIIQSKGMDRLKLHDCAIGEMGFTKNSSVAVTDISGSWFSEFKVTSSSNPFGHTFMWSDSEIATKRDPEVSRPASTLAQVSQYLSEKYHTEAALWFRSRELLREYSSLKGVMKFFSCISWMASHHGTRPGRLLVWLMFVWFFSSSLIAIFGNTTINPAISNPAPWVMDIDYQLRRAYSFPVQATFNPLGIFSMWNIIVACDLFSHLTAVIAGLINDALLVVFIAQIRRYFRMT